MTKTDSVQVRYFSGYIRNFARLCAELDITPLSREQREEEILLKGFAKWGVKLPEHLCGAFAFAIYDGEKLYVFRDQVGERHRAGLPGSTRKRSMSMRIAIASDHGGFEQKELLREWLIGLGHEVTDFGCDSEDSVDYPDYAVPAAEAVASGEADRGVLVCGTGVGMALAADKVRGVRAANIVRADFAKLCREHNDANVITLSGRFVSLDENKQIVETFLTTDFAGGRHERRVAKIMAIQEGN